jgi:sugar/nucleoside kinase (ribokinase family)
MTDDVLKVINQGVRMIHLAPMNPPKVLKMVKAIRDQKLDVKICVNSCIHYLGENSNRKAVMEAASLSDIFILNEKELHALTGKEMVSEAVDALKTDTLVLTLGEIGTIVRSSGRS